jgi:signal transduction histidine kinase
VALAEPQSWGELVGVGQEQEIQRLQSLLELRSTFLQLTIHELRRPIGIITGYLSMLEDGTFGTLAESSRPALRRMSKSLHEMEELLEGLATIARLEDGSGALRLERCRLWRVLAAAAETVKIEADAKRISIDLCVSAVVPDISADPERLHIALVNLLTNAVKYAPAGSRVALEARAEQPSGRVVIAVTDHGPGVASDEARRIFDKFYRGRETNESGVPGLGLGLYIVRRIVELHGGQVMLSSSKGHGATIAIVLPGYAARWEEEGPRLVPGHRPREEGAPGPSSAARDGPPSHASLDGGSSPVPDGGDSQGENGDGIGEG